jgi:hypothetical protein
MRSLLVFTLVLCGVATAQSPWLGEWGTASATTAQQLDISNCHNQTCVLGLDVTDGAMSCHSNEGVALTIRGDDASAPLPGPDAAHACVLKLHRDGASKSIAVSSAGEACHTYYCTDPTYNKLIFDHIFTLRSTQPWVGEHVRECFYMASPARLATCTDEALAKLEDDWRSLYGQFPLDGKVSDAGYQHTIAADNAILKQCDAATDAGNCLRSRYAADIVAMQAHKSSVVDASTERGDPVAGGRLAQKIAGRYRHRFGNADVQGHEYTSTDTMTLTPVGKASIKFDIELNFFNGHTCSISGGALFRKDGTFVFDDDPKTAGPDEPVCRLAIVSTAKGIELKDLSDNACKNYCGARGNLDGGSFKFTDRMP